MPSISFRSASADDDQFLFDLFCSAPHFALLPLQGSQREQLLRMQYEAQLRAFRAEFPGSHYDIVLLNGCAAGQFRLARRDSDFYLVDIAIASEARNTGIGTAILRQIQSEAEACGKPVRSSVFRFNPGSLRFHQRLGFEIAGEDEVRWRLEWRPANATIPTCL